MKERLIQLIYERAFKYSETPVFRLTSGKLSNYYFNCKAVTLSPEGMYLIGNIIYEMIEKLDVKGIGGLTLGADPIANAVAYTSYLRGNPIEAFVVRKKAKEHGTMQWIEGNISEGDSVVVVDDVITTGSSTIEAVSRLKEAGVFVKKVVVLVDRQEGGRENILRFLTECGFPAALEAVVLRDEVMQFRK
ncbi:MAG: orotate phosphoribosyltransferase [Thermodesulfovibrio sp.]|nr:orotate phosphoribosyltransferase [Thermodesulfovibrio sp.]MCX7724599.1 orotate phosphoribosyltransferase [Thermodesulfovibrio sp.]MDW7972970.1 orotate phosphoribosyltransferase [Thermodesulfovibrio sp.]